MSDYITDWSNIKIEINKSGIFVNGNDVASKATAPDVYALLLERLLSQSALQIGKKTVKETLHPVVFKCIYFCQSGNTAN